MSEQLARQPLRPLEATEPPEARGLRRDEVRMMVATRSDGAIRHARFNELSGLLEPGDLLVVNNSATLPAALPAARSDGIALELHLSTPAPDQAPNWWVVELRRDSAPFKEGQHGEEIRLAGGGRAVLVAPFARGNRLWLARLDLPVPVEEYLARHGHPIRYGYVPRAWPLEAYQNVYALEPGSAEMASAGRPFTPEVLTQLMARGVLVAPITLHTGVSSPEAHEAPFPERYRVPAETARLIDVVHGWGGRVIAVGTTVVRALESGEGEGWTNLVITPERGLRDVDGLLTGWHEPESSHLQMLEAVAGPELLARSYELALEHGYLWHEFGDVQLILP
ncbi:MAG TPA: S-adenosylmethionine:tRNA ribosyltransferase-isomerase [Thermoleophilaceae bacterium]